MAAGRVSFRSLMSFLAITNIISIVDVTGENQRQLRVKFKFKEEQRTGTTSDKAPYYYYLFIILKIMKILMVVLIKINFKSRALNSDIPYLGELKQIFKRTFV